jgi:hypothetical protein
MKTVSSKIGKNMLQLKIVLKDSDPVVWRRFLVPPDYPLDHLHILIQMVMGWTNSHLHQFRINGVKYAGPEYQKPPADMKDERTFKLSALLGEGAVFQYDYDFGDDWQHEITVEKIVPSEGGKSAPVCIEGEGDCPPEDCGGIHGYYELLNIIKDPSHPEYEEKSEWFRQFGPVEFDLKEINAALKKFARDPDADWRIE